MRIPSSAARSVNRFRLRLRTEPGRPEWDELVPVVDGRDVLDGEEALGLRPVELLTDTGAPLVPDPGEHHRVVVARCGCGEAGCGSLAVRISRDGARVTWSSWTGSLRQRGLADWVFDADEYAVEVRRAAVAWFRAG